MWNDFVQLKSLKQLIKFINLNDFFIHNFPVPAHSTVVLVKIINCRQNIVPVEFEVGRNRYGEIFFHAAHCVCWLQVDDKLCSTWCRSSNDKSFRWYVFSSFLHFVVNLFLCQMCLLMMMVLFRKEKRHNTRLSKLRSFHWN